ncbi:MAG: membrane protein insertion efficiency factor YidD [Desulfobacteraceae bacterium]|nr:membrane protein insertion efficiency factor YidD [Desulfobacteraceae bacterium]MBU4054868.1 membrane protein insertion efficiency factor YidD [Pseudomonadota bacterium]
MKIYFFFILLLVLTTTVSVVHAADPEGGKAREPQEPLLLAPIFAYQKHISPVLGGKCPMHPSCSRYCVDAVKKHGPVLGWIMTCDRLMRCGRDELASSRMVRIHGNSLGVDPVSNNDFWLKNHSR